MNGPKRPSEGSQSSAKRADGESRGSQAGGVRGVLAKGDIACAKQDPSADNQRLPGPPPTVRSATAWNEAGPLDHASRHRASRARAQNRTRLVRCHNPKRDDGTAQRSPRSAATRTGRLGPGRGCRSSLCASPGVAHLVGRRSPKVPSSDTGISLGGGLARSPRAGVEDLRGNTNLRLGIKITTQQVAARAGHTQQYQGLLPGRSRCPGPPQAGLLGHPLEVANQTMRQGRRHGKALS